MPFVVDRLLPEDLPAGLRLSTQAGWNQVGADWRRALDLCPDGLLAGRLDGRVVATGCVASISKDIRWIGLILVDEDMRGRGYGSIMMDHCLELAGRSGDTVVGLDASELGRPVYLKKGFVDVAPIDRWSGVLNADESTRRICAAGAEALDAVAALDRQACNVDRTPLLASLMRDPNAVTFIAGGRDPDGYAILYPGRLNPHLGPVVAKDRATFSSLLSAVAQVLHGQEVILDALRSLAASDQLKSCGLNVARNLTRMTLGRSQPVLMGPMVRAAVSFTWG